MNNQERQDLRQLLLDLLPVVEDVLPRYPKTAYRRTRAEEIILRLRAAIEELGKVSTP